MESEEVSHGDLENMDEIEDNVVSELESELEPIDKENEDEISDEDVESTNSRPQ